MNRSTRHALAALVAGGVLLNPAPAPAQEPRPAGPGLLSVLPEASRPALPDLGVFDPGGA